MAAQGNSLDSPNAYRGCVAGFRTTRPNRLGRSGSTTTTGLLIETTEELRDTVESSLPGGAAEMLGGRADVRTIEAETDFYTEGGWPRIPHAGWLGDDDTTTARFVETVREL